MYRRGRGLLRLHFPAQPFFSPEEYLARRDLYMALGGVAMYLLVALNFPSPRTRMWFVAGLMALALANCAVGAVQFFQGRPITSLFERPPATRDLRLAGQGGFYGYPNHLSRLSGNGGAPRGLSAAFWSPMAFLGKNRHRLYSSLVCLGCIVLTGSRGGYISATIGLLVLAGA